MVCLQTILKTFTSELPQTSDTSDKLQNKLFGNNALLGFFFFVNLSQRIGTVKFTDRLITTNKQEKKCPYSSGGI